MFRTLRGRLLAGILVLVTAGLVITDLSIYLTIRTTVTLRVDRSLINAAAAIDQAQSQPSVLLHNIDVVVRRTEISIVMLGPDGQMVAAVPETPTPQQPYPLDYLDPATLAGLRARPGQPTGIEPGGRPYRILYQPASGRFNLADQHGVNRPVTTIIVASAFRGEREALARLALDEALYSAGVLAVLAVLAVGVLRVGLRPLAGMAAAATTIAAGESDRRLPVDRPHSEVGRLAAALNQAFDERRRAEERLRDFLADASHELRTPLASIRGWADLYFQDALADPDRVETAMTRIINDSDRLIRLVEELLLLARLDEHRGLAAEPVDLGKLVAEVVDDARVAAPGHPITVTAPDAATVTGDPDRLGQVVRNLVGNALQHTPAGTPVRIVLAPGPPVRLTVADDGPGIPADAQERLFERFYRPSGTRSATGTGLGLAITRAIVRAHGGTITVTSSPVAGTRFDVTLPAGGSGQAGRRADP